MDPRTVIVCGVPPAINRHKLFSNLKQQIGGRDIISVTKNGSEARVTFENLAGLEEFCSSAPFVIEFGGRHTLHVKWFQALSYPESYPTQHEYGASGCSTFHYDPRKKYYWDEIAEVGIPGTPGNSCLLVQNIGEYQDFASIKRFFENERRTTGGKIQNIVRMHDGILIFFQEDRKVDDVLQAHGNNPLRFASNELVLYKKTIPPIYLDRMLLMTTSMDSSVKEDDQKFHLMLYMEEKIQAATVVSCMIMRMGYYLVKWEPPIGPEQLYDVARSITAKKDEVEKGFVLVRTDVLEVKSTDGIKVIDLSLFFSNKRRSHGGPVTQVIQRSPNHSLVFFGSHEDAENCEQHLNRQSQAAIGSKIIKVNLYHSQFEDVYQGENKDTDQSGRIFQWTPGEGEKEIVAFIKKHDLQIATFRSKFDQLSEVDFSQPGLIIFRSTKDNTHATLQKAFEEECVNVVHEAMKGFSFKQTKFENEKLALARNIYEELQDNHFSKNPSEEISVSWSGTKVEIVGEKDLVEKTMKNFEEWILKNHTIEIKVPKEKARLLTECDAWEDMQKKVEEFGAKCCIESDDIIRIHGTENSTKFGKVVYEGFVKSFNKTLLVGIDAEKRQFISKVIQDRLSSEIKKTILNEIHKAGIKGTLIIEGNVIFLTSPTEISHIQKEVILEILERIVMKKHIALDEHKKEVVTEKEWLDLMEEMSHGDTLTISVKDSFVFLVGLQSSIHGAEARIMDHFEKNVIHEETIKTTCGKARFIIEKSKDFSLFQQKQRGISCMIVHGGLLLKGKKIALHLAKVDVNNLLRTIIEQDESILTHGAYEYFHSDKGRECIRQTEVINNVTVLMDSKICEDCQKHDSERSNTLEKTPELAVPTTVPLISGMLKRKRSVTLSVWKKDITEHKCDAIINPTDHNRTMGGILSSTLIKKGGTHIEDELKKAKKFHTGDAFLTSAGKLKLIKNIIHVAVPRWGDQRNLCTKQLQSCIDESLKLASKKGFKTLAYPALCCGSATDTEVEEILQLIFRSVEDHLSQNETFSVKEIIFIEKEKEAVIRKLVSIAENVLKKNYEDEKVERKSVRTFLVLGNIAHEQADVIVNTTQYVKEMSSGAVSSALRKECGSQVLQECSKFQSSYPPGTVLETSGGDLKCKKLYHGITMKWDDRKSEEMVRDIVMKALKMSDNSGFRSVAFPSIATGGFKYPPQKVAYWMKDEIESFQGRSLSRVKIVLYPTDAASIQAFENQFKQSAKSQSQALSFPSTPSSSGSKPLKVAKYGCLEVSVYQGDITAEGSDVIVNSSNVRFDLSQGMVSNTILAKGGSKLQKELDAATGTTFRMTSGGALPCKKIVHAHFSAQNNELAETLLKVLVEIDSQNFTSVSIPALGTGMQYLSTTGIANVMLQCFQAIAKRNPANLRRINVVIFQQEMLAYFQKILCPPTKMTKFKGYVEEFFKGGDNGKPAEQDILVEDKELKIFLYSDDRKNLDNAIENLTGELNKVCSSTTISLQEEETLSVRDVNYLKETYNIKVDLHKTRFLNELVLSGMTENMVKAIPEIKEYIQAVTQARKSLKHVLWKHSEGGDEWEWFPDYDNAVLEEEFQKRKLSNYSASKVCLDFANRRPLDVDFHRRILSTSPPTGIIREELYTSALELPSTWEKCEHGEKGVLVSRDSPEYKAVRNQLPEKKFKTIVSVKRIQNRYLYSQFMTKKAEVEKKLRKYGSQNPIVRELFHGTTSSESILQNGFDRSYAGKNATAYGKGVYFAMDPNYSHRYTGSMSPSPPVERTIFIADVITGDYCLGSDEMSTIPARNPSNPNELYDSLVNDVNIPSIFVVLKDASVYPKYLVTYKSV